MFTGIAAATGSVRRLTRRGEDALIEIDTPLDLGDVRIGDSIAVSGACLTVTALSGKGFTADVSAETLSRTTLSSATAGSRVNLEKALRVGDPLGGHIVLGHVDGVGKITEKTVRSQSVILGCEIDPELMRYLVPKGSITVDGISLTVNSCEKNRFHVNIIPHTAAETTIGIKKVSDKVNIETDILSRYVERLLLGGEERGTTTGRSANSSGGIDLHMLSRQGFLK